MALFACHGGGTSPSDSGPVAGRGGQPGSPGGIGGALAPPDDAPGPQGGREAPPSEGGSGGTAHAPGTAGQGGAAGAGGQAGSAPVSTLKPRSVGCGKNETGTGRYTKQVMTIAGRSRDWFVRVPASYDRDKAYALVFDLHGTGGVAPGNGMGIELPAGNDAIIVSPQGIDGKWMLGADGEDVTFYDAMYDELRARFCIDERRVFVTGFSRGGAMANLLGCIRGDRIRAVGPLAGWHPARVGTCIGQPAAWFAHAKDDGVVGVVQGYRAQDYYLASNGCGEATMPVSPSPCIAHQGCNAGSDVVFCEITGGHGAPIEWSVPALWQFFAALPIR